MHLCLSYTLVINMQTLVSALCSFFPSGEKRRVGEWSFVFSSGLISSINHQSQLMCTSVSLCSALCGKRYSWTGKTLLHRGLAKQDKAFHLRYCICVYVRLCVRVIISFQNVLVPNMPTKEVTTCRETWSGSPVSVYLLTHTHTPRATYSNNTLSLLW